jgi:hypothetical protein
MKVHSVPTNTSPAHVVPASGADDETHVQVAVSQVVPTVQPTPPQSESVQALVLVHVQVASSQVRPSAEHVRPQLETSHELPVTHSPLAPQL